MKKLCILILAPVKFLSLRTWVCPVGKNCPLPFQAEHVVLSSEVQSWAALMRLHDILQHDWSEKQFLGKMQYAEELQLCHIPSGSLARRGACMFYLCQEEMEDTKLPKTQHSCFAGPVSWQSHGHFLGGYSPGSSVEMRPIALVAIGIILLEDQLCNRHRRQRTHSLLGRAQHWD